MPIGNAVINASPFIILAKTGLLGLLPKIFSEICMPETVSIEIIQGQDIASEQLREIELEETWLTRCLVPVVDDILVWNLGGGESEVLSFALESGNHIALIDDRAARKCAKTHSVKTLGTAGILVLAKKQGFVDDLRSEIKKLESAGLWISPEIVAVILKNDDK